jgi:hypothetical protein
MIFSFSLRLLVPFPGCGLSYLLPPVTPTPCPCAPGARSWSTWNNVAVSFLPSSNRRLTSRPSYTEIFFQVTTSIFIQIIFMECCNIKPLWIDGINPSFYIITNSLFTSDLPSDGWHVTKADYRFPLNKSVNGLILIFTCYFRLSVWYI